METLFESTYIDSKEIIEEFYRFFYFGRKFDIFYYFASALMVLLSLLCIVFIGSNIFYYLMILYVVFYYSYRFYCYRQKLKFSVKQEIELYGDNLRIDTLITDDCFRRTSSAGVDIKLGFSELRAVYKTKNLILVTTKARVTFMIPKTSFVKGDSESFVEFLRDKGVKIK